MNNIQSEQMPVSNLGTAPTPSTPSNTRRNWLIIAGIVALGLCVCTVLCGAVFGSAVVKVILEKPKIEKVIDQFMQAMSDKDAAKAYALFSANGKTQATLPDVEKMLAGNNYALFEGYEGLLVTNIIMGSNFNTRPNTPNGPTATVQGTITYAGGFTGNFSAVLEQEGDQWKIYGINITVPPTRLIAAHNLR